MRLLCAALGAAFFGFAAPSAVAEDDYKNAYVSELLGQGGYVLVMRHATSGGYNSDIGFSEGCTLAPGRGLDPIGFYEARALGHFLRSNSVPILKAYTSEMCRAWDTARLVAVGAPVIPHPSQVSTDPEIVAAFKKEIEAELAANPGQNIVLSNHSNIAPLYGAKAKPDEDHVPSGVVYVIDPSDWSIASRFDMVLEISKQTVTVE